VPPELKEMKSQESAVGQTLVLRCEASSEHLSLKFKWLKNGKEITKRNRPENIKIKSPKKQKTFSELRITKASLADAGEYTCKASNRFGDDITKARVTVTDASEPTGMVPVLTKGVNASSQLIDKISASTEGTNTSSSKKTKAQSKPKLTKESKTVSSDVFKRKGKEKKHTSYLVKVANDNKKETVELLNSYLAQLSGYVYST
ncbi:pro-neuregulin-1, membrane-bound isoform-like, partial [Python bivittatus]|uniref:Pro-neuregulin-1, membrane-bound isoform-like n=1 Tax=Python bivittatus TaxID=176946 RepID=A0A9F2WFD0_PYTBI